MFSLEPLHGKIESLNQYPNECKTLPTTAKVNRVNCFRIISTLNGCTKILGFMINASLTSEDSLGYTSDSVPFSRSKIAFYMRVLARVK